MCRFINNLSFFWNPTWNNMLKWYKSSGFKKRDVSNVRVTKVRTEYKAPGNGLTILRIHLGGTQMEGQKKEKKSFFKIQNEYRRKIRKKQEEPSPIAEMKSILLILFTLLFMKLLYLWM